MRLQHERTERTRVPVWGARPNQQAVWLHYIIVVTFCFAVGTVSESYRERLARKEMELERRKAELALYKTQENPHFLFNTLYTLYGLLITGSDKTVAMMEEFINLTKYMYLGTQRDFIPLREEVDYIEQYISLQQLRIGANASIEFRHDIKDGHLEIPPMLLITFVENAFKYGISSMEPCFVNIYLEGHDDTITFSISNSLVQGKNEHSLGMGIENCRKRLELLYPGRYSLSLGVNHDNVYNVNLTIRKETMTC